MVWDSGALIQPATAGGVGLEKRAVVRITAGDRPIKTAGWIVPGHADNSIALTLGWGRRRGGRIAKGRGFDVYPIRTSRTLGFVVGARISKTADEPYFFAQTQEHNSTEHRPIAHEATLAQYHQKP